MRSQPSFGKFDRPLILPDPQQLQNPPFVRCEPGHLADQRPHKLRALPERALASRRPRRQHALGHLVALVQADSDAFRVKDGIGRGRHGVQVRAGARRDARRIRRGDDESRAARRVPAAVRESK
eukprot:ctg_588.g268